MESSLVEASDKESQVLRLWSKRHYGSDSVEAGWDHHFAYSSMQGMTINHVILPALGHSFLRDGIPSTENKIAHMKPWPARSLN